MSNYLKTPGPFFPTAPFSLKTPGPFFAGPFFAPAPFSRAGFPPLPHPSPARGEGL